MAAKKQKNGQRGVLQGKCETARRIVLVGTYKGDQLTKWRGWYNYPISDDDFNAETQRRRGGGRVSSRAAADFSQVNELWLFKGTMEERRYKAEFVGIKTREELIRDYGYLAWERDDLAAKNAKTAKNGRARTPAAPNPHGTHYALFKTQLLYRHKGEVPGDAERVIIRTKDFARSPKIARQLKAYLESPDRKDPDLAKRLPEIITRLRPDQLRVCDPAVQMDFFSIFRQQEALRYAAIAANVASKARSEHRLTCVEICAGAGGQAIGLDMAGFEHVALVEYEPDYCAVLKSNRPDWNVICGDVHQFDGKPYQGIDLLAGGVPCPPFSVASKQLGADDERDLFPEAIRLIGEIRPKAVMLENVRGFLDPKFDDYRKQILDSISRLGYRVRIKLLNASDYGVPQLRPRIVIVGIRNDVNGEFTYPDAAKVSTPTVGEALHDLMSANGWRGADAWADNANKIAPTVVGGSKKHGGPDLGPVRARRAWAELGVDGLGVANNAPEPDFKGMPKLTKEMLARIQGFPDEWNLGRRKTLACRMIGNAFPPPVAQAVGQQIRKVLLHEKV